MIDPKVYRRLWHSVNRSQAHKTPSKRNARWLIKRIQIEAAESPDGPFVLDWLPVPGVTLHQWEELKRAAM